MRKAIGIILSVFFSIALLSGCYSSTSPVGKWYNADGRCLNIRSDKTWKLEDSYGTGTWKALDDGEYEFTDFYGDTQESKIHEDRYGQYIDFGYYGDFYKDEYPKGANDDTQNDISLGDLFDWPQDNQAEKETESPSIRTETTQPAQTESEANIIDPFENISFEIFGTSPYCQLTINTVNCSDETQKYVTYSADKEYYANGDTAIITATLTNTADETFTLSARSMDYEIPNQPEYVTSTDALDIDFLLEELNDYLTAQTSAAVNNWGLFNVHAAGNGGSIYKSIDSVEENEVYFTSIKKIKEHTEIEYYNSINFFYTIFATMDGGSINGGEAVTVYVNIIVYNVVKNPDGTIQWGTEHDEAYDFSCKASTDGITNLVTTTVSTHSADYNISDVTEHFLTTEEQP